MLCAEQLDELLQLCLVLGGGVGSLGGTEPCTHTHAHCAELVVLGDLCVVEVLALSGVTQRYGIHATGETVVRRSILVYVLDVRSARPRMPVVSHIGVIFAIVVN